MTRTIRKVSSSARRGAAVAAIPRSGVHGWSNSDSSRAVPARVSPVMVLATDRRFFDPAATAVPSGTAYTLRTTSGRPVRRIVAQTAPVRSQRRFLPPPCTYLVVSLSEPLKRPLFAFVGLSVSRCSMPEVLQVLASLVPATAGTLVFLVGGN